MVCDQINSLQISYVEWLGLAGTFKDCQYPLIGQLPTTQHYSNLYELCHFNYHIIVKLWVCAVSLLDRLCGITISEI